MSLDQTLQRLKEAFPPAEDALPALFVGHGNPMNALEANAFSDAWRAVGAALPRPRAVLCVSAHWETRGTQVTAMRQPETIHDFGGFPQALFDFQYPAPGSPELAALTVETVTKTPVHAVDDWGLDHGTWSVLARLYPDAGIPVVQLSLDRTQPPAFHYALGRELRGLRRRGVLIVGSGNIVHNLRRVAWDDSAADWALAFDATVKERLLAGDHEALIHYERLGPEAALSIPTNEHYLPLLYTLALQEKGEAIRFFAERVTLRALSMRSLLLGA